MSKRYAIVGVTLAAMIFVFCAGIIAARWPIANPFENINVTRIYLRPAYNCDVVEMKGGQTLTAIVNQLASARPVERTASEIRVAPWLVVETAEGFRAVSISSVAHNLSWKRVLEDRGHSTAEPKFMFSESVTFEFENRRWQCDVNPFREALQLEDIKLVQDSERLDGT